MRPDRSAASDQSLQVLVRLAPSCRSACGNSKRCRARHLRRASSGCPSARRYRRRAPAIRKSRSRPAPRPAGRCGPYRRWPPARNPADGQQARGFAFVGLQHQRHLAVARQPVDAAVAVGRKQKLVRQRQQVVDVLFFGTPQGLDCVVRIDAIYRRPPRRSDPPPG